MTDTNTAEMKNEVVVTIEGRDNHIPLESLSLTMLSTEREILAAVRPTLTEMGLADIEDEGGEMTYTVRKALNSNSIYVYPKPGLGYIGC